MKIAILGAGAIGCYYGARLALAGNEVHFLMRSEREYVKEHGLTIESILGDMRLEHVNVPASSAEVGPCDLVVIAWKTTANGNIGHCLPSLLGPNTRVITLENGMGNAETIVKAVPEVKNRLCCAVCFISSFRTSPGHVKHMANGAISMAPAFSNPDLLPMTEEIAQVFKEAQIPARVYPNSEHIMWNKVLWNVPFNGLSILNDGADVLQILTAPSPNGEDHVRALMEDIIKGAKARGFNLRPDLIEKQIEVTYSMGHYRPSSGIDFMMGREVEFESIWKIPFNLAVEAGAELPVWAKLNSELEAKLALRDARMKHQLS